MALGAVSACLGRADGGAGCAALDAREVRAVSEDLLQGLQGVQAPSPEGVSLLVALLPRLCEKLDAVAKQGDRLERVEDGQKEIKDKIDKSAEAHQALQTQYLNQSHKHELEIQEIQLRLKNYETTVEKVEELDKKVFAYALLAAVAGAVVGAMFTGLPAWLERHPEKDSRLIMPPALTRGKG